MANKKSSKNSTPQVMDVSKPGKTPPEATSKPIIVNRKPMAADPMMSDKDKSENDSEDSSANHNISRSSGKVIQPLSSLGNVDAKTEEEPKTDQSDTGDKDEAPAETAKEEQAVEKLADVATGKESEPEQEEESSKTGDELDKPDEPEDEGHEKIEVRRVKKDPELDKEETKDSIPDDELVDKPEAEDDSESSGEESDDSQLEPEEKKEPDTSAEKPSPDIVEQAAAETATVNAVASKARDKGAEHKKAEEERKKQENIQHLIETKRFFLPIKHSRKHRRSKTITLLVLLLVLVAGGFAAANGYLDLSDIKLPGGYSSENEEIEAPVAQQEPTEEETAQEQQQETAMITAARDSERKSDIDSIASNLEAYYVENDKYPTIGQLNDPKFREQNLPDLDKESLLDPEGLDYVVTETAAPNTYAYVTSPVNCDNVEINCAVYELTATLSDGKKYNKTTQE